jgi:hypothetical protein
MNVAAGADRAGLGTASLLWRVGFKGCYASGGGKVIKGL